MSDQSLQQSCRVFLFIVCTLITGILVVVGIIGNSLTFAVFWKGNFKASTSTLFMCLSLTDSVVLLTSFLLFSIVPFVDYMDCMEGLLKMYSHAPVLVNCLTCTYYVAQATTIWMTVLIAANRFIIVCLPLKAPKWCTNTKVKIELAAVLLLAVLYNTPMFLMISSTSNLHKLIVFNVLYGVFILILPISILALLNIRLIKALHTHHRMQSQNRRTASQRNDTSMTFVLIIIVIVLIACQVPALIHQALFAAKQHVFDCGGYLFYLPPISDMLIVLNSAVNFIIYILFNKQFRNVLIKKVFKRQAAKQVVVGQEMAGPERAGPERAGPERASGELVIDNHH